MTIITQKQQQAMIAEAVQIATLSETAAKHFPNGLKVDDLISTLTAKKPKDVSIEQPKKQIDDGDTTFLVRKNGVKTTFEIHESGNPAKNADHLVTIKEGTARAETSRLSAAEIAVVALGLK